MCQQIGKKARTDTLVYGFAILTVWSGLTVCKIEGCYLAGWDVCPSCAARERRRVVRERNQEKRKEQGEQWQLGITNVGRWCKQGCCDRNNPKPGDCRI